MALMMSSVTIRPRLTAWLDLKRPFIRRNVDLDPLVRPIIEAARPGAQLGQIGADVDPLDAVGGVEMALHRGDRHHPLMGVAQLVAGFLGGDRAGLEQQDAGDDLEAVGDAVLHLAKQGLVLGEQLLGMLEQLLLLPLDGALGGDVLEGDEDGRAGAGPRSGPGAR